MMSRMKHKDQIHDETSERRKEKRRRGGRRRRRREEEEEEENALKEVDENGPSVVAMRGLAKRRASLSLLISSDSGVTERKDEPIERVNTSQSMCHTNLT